MSFETYYDEYCLPQGDYFKVHRKRFVQSWSFLEALGLKSGGKLLDVGGTGPISSYLRDFYGWQAEDTSNDLRYPIEHVSDKFDLVICTETIEHIKDLDSSEIADLEAFNYSGILVMLNELKRVMKADGCLFLSTPNANSYITLHRWLTGDIMLMDPNHVREFSVQELGRIARQAGLYPKSIVTVDSWDVQYASTMARLKTQFVRYLLRRLSPRVERGDNIFGLFEKTL